MSEQKTGTITLTVPWHEEPVARADGALWDGIGRTGAAKDGRSIAVLHANIGKALLASWPGEPATDYAKRLAEIEAWATRLGALEDEQIEDMSYEDLAAELGAAVGYVPWLLRQLRGKAAGIADEVDPKG
jgi:hypothetical protein